MVVPPRSYQFDQSGEYAWLTNLLQIRLTMRNKINTRVVAQNQSALQSGIAFRPAGEKKTQVVLRSCHLLEAKNSVARVCIRPAYQGGWNTDLLWSSIIRWTY